MNFIIKRGDIYWVKLPENDFTCIQKFDRLCIVVSNDKCNSYSPIITICPLTTIHKRKDLKTHTFFEINKKLNVLLAEQITCISKSQLIKYVTTITDINIINRINNCIKIQLELI